MVVFRAGLLGLSLGQLALALPPSLDLFLKDPSLAHAPTSSSAAPNIGATSQVRIY